MTLTAQPIRLDSECQPECIAHTPECIAGEMLDKLHHLAKEMEGILNMVPTREMSLAKTQLENAVMWAEKSISKSTRLLISMQWHG